MPREHEFLSGHDALLDVHVKRIHEYKRQLLNALQEEIWNVVPVPVRPEG